MGGGLHGREVEGPPAHRFGRKSRKGLGIGFQVGGVRPGIGQAHTHMC